MCFPKRTSLPSLFLSATMLTFWLGVIFFFSSLPGNPTSYDPPLWYFVERKSAHIFEYAILMLLAVRLVKEYFCTERFTKQLLLAAVFSLAYAASDELHQFFVPYRGARLTDVLIDGMGIFLMTFLMWGWRKRGKW